jgi:hypothetical protein
MRREVRAEFPEGDGWIATMVAVDATSDPLLRVHAEVLQEFLAAVVFITLSGCSFRQPVEGFSSPRSREMRLNVE